MNTEKEISVQIIKSFNKTDLADLCDITEQAINNGGGFGWLKLPPRETLNNYWKGTLLVPNRKVVVGRINNVIAGSLQIILKPKNNEAQQNIANITSHFVAPWARGYGLAKKMIDVAENTALELGSNCIHLDVRETQDAAIKLFESKGYIKWGTNPIYAFINGKVLKGVFYYKMLK
tara:strand:+ start:17 stop:544 length:528 start_codon:yes stop_codon:yes gene_type:complete